MRAAALIAALGAVVIALALALPHSSRSGRAAPTLPKTLLQGRPTTLASLRGRPALVNFFASWCPPCNREAPDLQRAYARLAGRVGVVAVDWNDGRRAALAFVRRFGWTLPVLQDASGLVGDDYGLSGLPTTFVLDARGRILRRLTGPQTTKALLAAARV